MPIIQPPPTPPATPLWWLGYRLIQAGEYFDSLYHSLQNIYLLGDYLATPFYYIGWYVKEAGKLAQDFDNIYLNTKKWVDYIIEVNGLRTLIQGVWGEFDAIRRSPKDWLISKIVLLSTDMPYLWLLPGYWVSKYLRQQFPWISQFLDNARNYIVNQIRSYLWWLPYFFDNPQAFIIEFAKQGNVVIAQFLTNPQGHVASLLVKQYPWLGQFFSNPNSFILNGLRAASPIITALLVNPSLFIRGYVQNLLGVREVFWSNPFGYITDEVLKLLGQQLNFYADRLKNIVIELIMKFI